MDEQFKGFREELKSFILENFETATKNFTRLEGQFGELKNEFGELKNESREMKNQFREVKQTLQNNKTDLTTCQDTVSFHHNQLQKQQFAIDATIDRLVKLNDSDASMAKTHRFFQSSMSQFCSRLKTELDQGVKAYNDYVRKQNRTAFQQHPNAPLKPLRCVLTNIEIRPFPNSIQEIHNLDVEVTTILSELDIDTQSEDIEDLRKQLHEAIAG
uniref:Uncharacterized protein n=1 Tax=Bionectria ochroleuca TaxID=29856 RepID=A0A8H7N1Y0_BIOOC